MTFSGHTQPSSPEPVWRRGLRFRLLAVFVLALALRSGFGTYRIVGASGGSALEFPDEQQYWMMAESLRSGTGLRDELGFRATRMPVYPAILSVFCGVERGVETAKAFQWVVGALAAVVVCVVATVLFDGRAGLLAGVLVALDPFLIFFSSLLLTETLFIFCLAAFYVAVAPVIRCPDSCVRSWRRWLGIGVTATACVYARESGLGLVVVLSVLLLVWYRLERRALAGIAVVWIVVAVSLLPWAVRNRVVLGEWCWLTTRAGISLYDGVGPQATGASDLGSVKGMEATRNLSEVQWNRYFLSESLTAIRSDPGRIVRLAGTKLARMWNPVPNADGYQSVSVRFVSACWVCSVLVLALFGLWHLVRGHGRWGLRVTVFLLLPAFYLSAVHSVFVGSVRYRLVAMPMLEIIAAVGAWVVFDRVRMWRGIRGR